MQISNGVEEFLNIINKFQETKILVVGDLMLDEYLVGNVDRISPEAPIPILDVKKTFYTPGGAANTAYNIKSLGGQVVLAGVVGPDEKGSLLKSLLAEKGINIEAMVVDSQRITTLKTRVVAKNQQIVRVDREDRRPVSQEIEQKIFQLVEGKMPELKAVVISDYAKGLLTPALTGKIITLARKWNVFSLVDAKGPDFSKYKGCNIITPNKQELAKSLNLSAEQLSSESRFLQAGKMLLAHVMADGALVKCGAEGMTLFSREDNIFHYPALNKNAVDVSGAGDTAIATLALAFAAGADFKKAVILAGHACGVEVGKLGTAVVSPEELWASLKTQKI